MALGFGTVLGTASTDRVTSAAEVVPATLSFHCWSNRNGDGGGGLGRMIDHTAMIMLYNTTGTEYGFFNGTSTFWRWTRPTASTWIPIGGRVDTSNLANDPTIFQSGTKLTVGSGITQINADSNYNVSSATWIVGNGPTAARGWDGMIAIPAIWNILLTDEEFALLAAGADPASIQPGNLIHYLPFTDLTGNDTQGAAWTVTGAAVQPNPSGVPSGGTINLTIGAISSDPVAASISITQTQVLVIDTAVSQPVMSDISITIGTPTVVILDSDAMLSAPSLTPIEIVIADGNVNLAIAHLASRPRISPAGVEIAHNSALVIKLIL